MRAPARRILGPSAAVLVLLLGAGIPPATAQPPQYGPSYYAYCPLHGGHAQAWHAAHHDDHDPWPGGGQLVAPADRYGALLERFNEVVYAYESLMAENRALYKDYNELLHKYNDALARNDAIEVCLCSAASLEEAQACPYR